MDRSFVAAGCIAAAALAGAFAIWPRPAPAPPVEVVAPLGGGAAASAAVIVHVSGAVARPGLVSLPPGSRVADAIIAAGGALPDADLSVVNLATPVVPGMQLVVPPASGDRPGDATGPGGRIHINRADVAALMTLPGVGPVLAQRIVEHRERHGPFTTVEDLLDVPGIGEAKLAALRDHVVVP